MEEEEEGEGGASDLQAQFSRGGETFIVIHINSSIQNNSENKECTPPTVTYRHFSKQLNGNRPCHGERTPSSISSEAQCVIER